MNTNDFSGAPFGPKCLGPLSFAFKGAHHALRQGIELLKDEKKILGKNYFENIF